MHTTISIRSISVRGAKTWNLSFFCLCITHFEPCDWLTQFSYITLFTFYICKVWHCQCTFSITHTRLHILHYSLYITHFTLVCHWLMCELVWESTWVCSREWVYISVDVFIGACVCNYLKCASLYACHSLHECVLYNVHTLTMTLDECV